MSELAERIHVTRSRANPGGGGAGEAAPSLPRAASRRG